MSARKVALAIGAVAAALSLSGRTGATPDPNTTRTDGSDSSDFKETRVKLQDGRTVLCITTGIHPATSCDWANAK